MSKKKNSRISRTDIAFNRKLIAIPIIVFLAKIIIMFNASTPVWKTWQGGWAGSDGEHYLIGTLAILVDGIFSPEIKLQFWPAGYPLILSIFGKISLTHILYFVSFFQSAFYAFASYYFVNTIRKTRIQEVAFTFAVLLGINPTLSLSSLVVGYESLVASCTLLIVAKLLKNKNLETTKSMLVTTAFLGGFLALSSFIQPRYLIFGFVLLPLWVLFEESRKKAAALVALFSLLVILVAPGALLIRNHYANDKWVISTNLGSTMRIGAGPEATGGYIEDNKSVECKSTTGLLEPSDSEIQKCVISWYLANPARTLRLAVNKSIYFWSPWSGPLANGTTARNPWLKIDPIMNIVKNSQGRDLIIGPIGQLVSWMWLLGGLGLLFSGFFWFFKIGGSVRNLAWFSLTPILLSWLVSIATIGDHRFRIPIMGLSLFLQVGGIYALRNRFSTLKFEAAFEQPARSR